MRAAAGAALRAAAGASCGSASSGSAGAISTSLRALARPEGGQSGQGHEREAQRLWPAMDRRHRNTRSFAHAKADSISRTRTGGENPGDCA